MLRMLLRLYIYIYIYKIISMLQSLLFVASVAELLKKKQVTKRCKVFKNVANDARPTK